MIGPSTGVHVYLTCGVINMRKGIEGLDVRAQDHLRQKPTGGSVFAFRGCRGDGLSHLHTRQFQDNFMDFMKRDCLKDATLLPIGKSQSAAE